MRALLDIVPRTAAGWWLGAQLLGLHLVALVGLTGPVTPSLALFGLVAQGVVLFGMEGIAHRYFAHRSYKTSRLFQLVLAVWAGITVQRGMLWWAWTHRQHHAHVDTPRDPHSPVHHGLPRAYGGWILDPAWLHTEEGQVSDLARYPELRFLERFWQLPGLAWCAALVLAAHLGVFGPVSALSALAWGFAAPAAVGVHLTWWINVVTHYHDPMWVGVRTWGRYRRFDTRDSSANARWLALLTFGAGYHNNHHRFGSSARSGYFDDEPDPGWWVLRLWERLGLIWDLRVPSAVAEREAA